MQSRVGGSGGLVAVDVFGRWSFAGPVSPDNLVHCYLNFSNDHLFPTRISKQYITAMCWSASPDWLERMGQLNLTRWTLVPLSEISHIGNFCTGGLLSSPQSGCHGAPLPGMMRYFFLLSFLQKSPKVLPLTVWTINPSLNYFTRLDIYDIFENAVKDRHSSWDSLRTLLRLQNFKTANQHVLLSTHPYWLQMALHVYIWN